MIGHLKMRYSIEIICCGLQKTGKGVTGLSYNPTKIILEKEDKFGGREDHSEGGEK